jgi:hypothetical protein
VESDLPFLTARSVQWGGTGVGQLQTFGFEIGSLVHDMEKENDTHEQLEL